MPNYIRTGPFTNGGAPGISAAFLNAVENVLEQPSGGTELGQYYLGGWTAAVNDTLSYWYPTLSRTATPVSTTIDTSILSPVSVNAPLVDHLGTSGAHISTSATGASTNAGCGGLLTVNF